MANYRQWISKGFHYSKNYLAAIRYLILLAIIIFVGIVNLTSTPSKLRTVALIGISQPGMCDDRNGFYHVLSRPIYEANGVILSNPICYDINEKPCIDSTHLKQCTNDVFDEKFFEETVLTFTKNFEMPDHDYFPFLLTILGLSFLSVYLIIYGGIALTHEIQLKLSAVNEIVGFLLALFIFLSAFTNAMKFDEDCLSLFKKTSTSSVSEGQQQKYCNALTSCGLTISSVVDLRGNISQYYNKFMANVGIVWICFMVVHSTLFLIYFLEGRREYLEQRRNRAILDLTGEALTKALSQVAPSFIDMYIDHWQYLDSCDQALLHSNNGDNSNENNGQQQQQQLGDQENGMCEECSICLCRLWPTVEEINQLRANNNRNKITTATTTTTTTTMPSVGDDVEMVPLASEGNSLLQQPSPEQQQPLPENENVLNPLRWWQKKRSYIALPTNNNNNNDHDHLLPNNNSSNNSNPENENNEEEKVLQLLRCRHAFHQTCILQWVTTNANTACPVCRDELRQNHNSNFTGANF